jgi:uncharacterized membrane protein YhaH (DUF805 family)
MRALIIVAEWIAWMVAIWLFVGLVGALRWLAPGAEPGPDAWLAVFLKLAGLIALIAVWTVTARRTDSANQSADALT